MPDRRKRDLDNLLKCPLDALHHAKIICDDSQIDKITISRCQISSPAKLLVGIIPL